MITGTRSELLAGRVAMVTGGSRGIGAAVSRALAAHGASVRVTPRAHPHAADAVVADVRAAGRRGVAVLGDATDRQDVADMVASAAAELGDVDVLVANAVGDTTGMTSLGGSVLESAATVQDKVDEQLAATVEVCRQVVPGMRRRGGGSIVVIGASVTRQSSVAARLAQIGVAKSAQDALVRHLAADLGPDDIRVNVVAPGMVPTDANAGPERDEAMTAIARNTPLRRVSEAADVAGVVVALASDLMRQVTGAVLPVDGGMTMA